MDEKNKQGDRGWSVASVYKTSLSSSAYNAAIFVLLTGHSQP